MDFENWSAVGGKFKPEGWVWTNSRLVDENWAFYWEPEQPSQNGTYAIKLGVWYNYTKDAALQIAPINMRPTALKGYYKYTDNTVMDGSGNLIADTAQVSVYLTKWNASTSISDTLGVGMLDLGASDNYKDFSCKITYNSAEQPDSIHVFLDCSLVGRALSGAIVMGSGVASFFTVDNLTLEGNALAVGSVEKQTKVTPYPNPTTGILHLNGFSGKVTVLTMHGVKAAIINLNKGEDLSLAQLVPGIYMLQLEDANGAQTLKVIKE